MNRPTLPTLPRLRLIDGVVLAAVALLGLKTMGLLSDRGPADESGADRPGFARVLAHARSNWEPTDPTTTGSVPAPPEPKPAEPKPAEPAAAAVPAAEPAPGPSRTERALLERLGERRDDLQRRDREMETRQRLIEDQERRLDQKLGEIKSIEDRQGAAGAKRGEAEAAGLKSLVTMYEAMKPKEAARVFDRLPQDVLVPVVTGMNPRKMSEVLAAMTPENAQKLTVALAKRAKNADDKPASGASLPVGELPAIEPLRR